MEEITRINELLIKRISESISLELRSLIADSAIEKGKRLRGRLLLEFSGKNNPRVYELAAAMELIHLATLIHDDLMDEPKMRRGTLPLYTRCGKNMAVLYGDFLLSEAIKWIWELNNSQIMSLLSKTVTEIVKGEMLHQCHQKDLNLKADTYLNIIRKKTAFLFGACCEMGAILRNSHKISLKSAFMAGINLGIAYQIIDDSQDYLDLETMGEEEAYFLDAKNGMITLPIIYLLEECSFEERLFINKIMGNGNSGEINDISKIVNWMKEYGSISKSLILAQKYLAEAQGIIFKHKNFSSKEDLANILSSFKERIVLIIRTLEGGTLVCRN